MSVPPSPGRPPVELDRILGAAIALVDEDGADALSMRGLAGRLGSGTATLYRRFSGRAELVAQVIDTVMGELQYDEDILRTVSWRQALEASARGMFEVLCRHPNVAQLLLEQDPVGPNTLAMRERALQLLLDADFPPHLAVRAWSTLARFVLGFASQLRSVTHDKPTSPWFTVDVIDFPASIAVSEYVPIPLADEFTFGLTLIIDGLSHQLQGLPGPS